MSESWDKLTSDYLNVKIRLLFIVRFKWGSVHCLLFFVYTGDYIISGYQEREGVSVCARARVFDHDQVKKLDGSEIYLKYEVTFLVFHEGVVWSWCSSQSILKVYESSHYTKHVDREKKKMRTKIVEQDF